MRALRAARELQLPQWCLAAGFVRNLVWDRLHGHATTTPLSDVDLIYFDPHDTSSERDRCLETQLTRICPEQSWSVKNQARMHLRNDDPPYTSTRDAMGYWVEIETAVGARLEEDASVAIVHTFPLDSLFTLHVTPNASRLKPEVFLQRLIQKRWLERWPLLKVMPAGSPPRVLS